MGNNRPQSPMQGGKGVQGKRGEVMDKFVNLENELYCQVIKNQKDELRPDDALFALHNVMEVQRKLDITEAMCRASKIHRGE